MDSIESRPERLEAKSKSLTVVIIVSVLLTIGGIIFFFGNTLTRLECLKDDSPLSLEHACTLSSESLASPSALVRAILPTSLVRTEHTLPIPLIESVRTVRHVERDSDDNERVQFLVRFNVDTSLARQLLAGDAAAARAPGVSPSLPLRPATRALISAAVDRDWVDYAEFSEAYALDAEALSRRLDTFVRAAKSNPGSTRAAVFNDTRDTGFWDELCVFAALIVVAFLSVFVPTCQTTVLDARAGTLHFVETSLIGRFCKNEVIPLSQVIRFEERVAVRRSSDDTEDKYYYSIYAVVRRQPGRGPGDAGESGLSLGLSDVSDRAQCAASLDKFTFWLREYRQRGAARSDALFARALSASAGAAPGASAGSGAAGVAGIAGALVEAQEGAEEGEVNAEASADAIEGRIGAGLLGPGFGGGSAADAAGARKVCCVCMDDQRAVRTVFLPCKHLACCEVCSAVLTNCPLCRRRIDDMMTVFT